MDTYKKTFPASGFTLPNPLYKFYYERIGVMKKLFIMLLTLTIITTWLSGCGGKNSSKKDREIFQRIPILLTPPQIPI